MILCLFSHTEITIVARKYTTTDNEKCEVQFNPKKMKKIFTLIALAFLVLTSKAQFTENFENGINSLTGNCWNINQVDWTNDPSEVITGIGSLYTNPPVSSVSTKDVITPALNINSTSLTVSFNYRLASKITGLATRTIELGLLDASNNYTLLTIIPLGTSTPITTQTYSNTFTVATGLQKLVIKFGGATGAGNARVILDDLYTSASAKYGPVNHCNSAPVAINDNYSGIIGAEVTGNVILNDNEPDGETMTASIVATSPNGTVVLNANGTFSFTPNPGFTGPIATFTYRLNDNGYAPLNSNVATVTILYSAAKLLPVKLNNFQGSKNKSNVQLQWNVGLNEIANTFEVERSTDGKNFSTASLIFGTEKSGNETYSYNEVNEDVKVYYRLKMVDKSDVLTYSKILVFNSNGKNTKTLDIIGNSVSDKLTVSFQADASNTSELRILDMNGKMIAKQTIKASKGSNLASISLPSAMMTGMYIASLSSENVNSTAKFIKQ